MKAIAFLGVATILLHKTDIKCHLCLAYFFGAIDLHEDVDKIGLHCDMEHVVGYKSTLSIFANWETAFTNKVITYHVAMVNLRDRIVL